MPYKCPEKNKKYKAEHYQKNKGKYKASLKKNRNAARDKKRKFIKKHKLLCTCQRCGYKENAASLEYHHIDPSDKDRAVSELVAGNWGLKRIKEEIRKCVVLCSICHRQVHKEMDEGIEHDWSK